VANYIKDPQAVLDYGMDWGAKGWLQSGETITTSTWTVATGITKGATSNTTTTTTVWLSGGTVGTTYAATNTVVTSMGRTDERTITIRVQDR
jgi:hypothetical protein